MTYLRVLILLLCVALGFVVFGIFDQGVGAQVRQSNERLELLSASEMIKALTHAPRGKIDGTDLSDGGIVHFGLENGEDLPRRHNPNSIRRL